MKTREPDEGSLSPGCHEPQPARVAFDAKFTLRLETVEIGPDRLRHVPRDLRRPDVIGPGQRCRRLGRPVSAGAPVEVGEDGTASQHRDSGVIREALVAFNKLRYIVSPKHNQDEISQL